jgi:hypothetical protein
MTTATCQNDANIKKSYNNLKISTIIPIEALLVVKLLHAKTFKSEEVNKNPGIVFRFKVGYVSRYMWCTGKEWQSLH